MLMISAHFAVIYEVVWKLNNFKVKCEAGQPVRFGQMKLDPNWAMEAGRQGCKEEVGGITPQ